MVRLLGGEVCTNIFRRSSSMGTRVTQSSRKAATTNKHQQQSRYPESLQTCIVWLKMAVIRENSNVLQQNFKHSLSLAVHLGFRPWMRSTKKVSSTVPVPSEVGGVPAPVEGVVWRSAE